MTLHEVAGWLRQLYINRDFTTDTVKASDIERMRKHVLEAIEVAERTSPVTKDADPRKDSAPAMCSPDIETEVRQIEAAACRLKLGSIESVSFTRPDGSGWSIN